MLSTRAGAGVRSTHRIFIFLLLSLVDGRGVLSAQVDRGADEADEADGPRWQRSMASLASWRRRPIAVYDRVYRWVNGLDRPESQVGPVLRLRVRSSRRDVRLKDGALVRRGEPIGIMHLDNERVVSLHADGVSREAIGLEFRRQFLASLRELAGLADRGRLAGVPAFTATTIFHHALGRLGFEPARGSSGGSALVGAYQRALLASLRPAGHARLDARTRRHARQLWLSREALRARFGGGAGPASDRP